MSKGVLALNVNGDITYCVSPPELRGTGRCNHVTHQTEEETPEEFINRINFEQDNEIDKSKNVGKQAEEIGQDEINALAKEIDRIAGCKVTTENFHEVVKKLTPEQISEIANIGFNAAPIFSLPIREEEYEDQNVKNKLYFTNMYKYGVGGNASAIAQMFVRAGASPTHKGKIEDVESSYAEGLTPDEYFARQYYARVAMITKGVGTSKPGYCISEDSQVIIVEDGKKEIIFWDELQVGDQFIDNSVVKEIQNWQNKRCLTISVKGFHPITVSYDHLILADIILNNKKVHNLAASREIREIVGETDIGWVCAEDVYYMYKNNAKIILSTGNEIVDIKDAGYKKVRCISTDTGYYSVGGFVSHNTARKLFYASSDIQVFNDCGGPYINAMSCKLPHGHVCVKCARLTNGGQRVKEGDLVGGVVSTALSEGLTQASMSLKHPIWEDQEITVIRKFKEQ